MLARTVRASHDGQQLQSALFRVALDSSKISAQQLRELLCAQYGEGHVPLYHGPSPISFAVSARLGISPRLVNGKPLTSPPFPPNKPFSIRARRFYPRWLLCTHTRRPFIHASSMGSLDPSHCTPRPNDSRIPSTDLHPTTHSTRTRSGADNKRHPAI